MTFQQMGFNLFHMRIALAQMNPVLGDLEGNVQKMLLWTQRAADKSCQLIVFPELSVLGYSPNDLLERPEVIEAQNKALATFFKKKPKSIEVIVGGLLEVPGVPFLANAAYVSNRQKRPILKTLLPTYDVFDESRFFRAGKIEEHVVELKKQKALVLICEDMWAWERNPSENPLKKIKKSAVDIVISINASPYSLHKQKRRLNVAKQTAKYFSAPVVYVNMVGAQDELIFDGASFVVNKSGQLIAQSAFCSEDLNIVDTEKSEGGVRKGAQAPVEQLHAVLSLGIRDFALKNGFSKIHIGSSGGIDSAVVAALACDALGPQNVTTIAMPGPFSHEKSQRLAEELAHNLGCRFATVPIKEIYDRTIQDYETVFGEMPFGLVHENLQARVRANILMMFANSQHSLLLATGNKSEYATGYSTLYGDMCGGLAPLGDLLKRQVYDLAAYYNRERSLIPKEIISRPPSAELRPNQKDQDTLPPYDDLDAAVDKIVTGYKSATNKTEKWLLKKLAASEFKRWQAPPILRVSSRAFGRGRRYPITNGFYKRFP